MAHSNSHDNQELGLMTDWQSESRLAPTLVGTHGEAYRDLCNWLDGIDRLAESFHLN